MKQCSNALQRSHMMHVARACFSHWHPFQRLQCNFSLVRADVLDSSWLKRRRADACEPFQNLLPCATHYSDVAKRTAKDCDFQHCPANAL